MRYLRGTADYGLASPDASGDCVGYLDADWGGDLEHSKKDKCSNWQKQRFLERKTAEKPANEQRKRGAVFKCVVRKTSRNGGNPAHAHPKRCNCARRVWSSEINAPIGRNNVPVVPAHRKLGAVTITYICAYTTREIKVAMDNVECMNIYLQRSRGKRSNACIQRENVRNAYAHQKRANAYRAVT